MLLGSRFKEINGLDIKDGKGNFVIPPHSIWQGEIEI
jgi:hypothetical protein